jgi:uncharacterized protein YukE
VTDGQTLVARQIDGQTVYGSVYSNGDFISQDGTILQLPDGAVETGITDPTTDEFLPNGQVRQIGGQSVYGSVDPSSGDFISEDGTTLQLPDGSVEHGKLTADGSFLAETTVNGQQVWGNYGSDGSFVSQDGTIYVSPTGAVETGITDPSTNEFLPNGQVRQIGGQSVYGSVDPSTGDFISEDGTTLQLPSGFTEHGETANGTFLAELIVNGQPVTGNYGSDGSFLSEDGTTYVSPTGAVQTGITDPVTGEFIPGGSTHTLPDGTVLYGYTDNGSFYTYDGTEIVLSNGTAVSGTLDTGTGIFTGGNGADYFVGQSGIVAVTPQSDGSYIQPNGDVIMTAQSWSVDLAAFTDAMQVVSTNTQSISDAYESIQMQYTVAETVWSSPAAQSFTDLTTTINSAMSQLNSVLGSIYAAMQSSYDNYHQTEQGNTNNLTGS